MPNGILFYEILPLACIKPIIDIYICQSVLLSLKLTKYLII